MDLVLLRVCRFVKEIRRHLERVLAVYEGVRVPYILNAVIRHFDFPAAVRKKNIRPLRPSKVSGVTVVLIVHCLAHDVDIRLLTIQFGRLITGVCHAG